MLRLKAKEFSEYPEFKAALGWYQKWKRRHSVSLRTKTTLAQHLPEDLEQQTVSQGVQRHGWNFVLKNRRKIGKSIVLLSTKIASLHPIRVTIYNYPLKVSHETRRHFESRPKTVNIQGYCELREPIRTCENCYPLIWWILIKLWVLRFYVCRI